MLVEEKDVQTCINIISKYKLHESISHIVWDQGLFHHVENALDEPEGRVVTAQFDYSLLIPERRSVEMYSEKGCKFMYGLLHRLIIQSTPILNPSVLILLPTVSLTCEQTKNRVMCSPVAGMQAMTDICFRFG
jgi:hypothetical protein